MSAQVYSIAGDLPETLSVGEPNDAAIAVLESFLEMAKSGQLTGLAVAASTRTGKVFERASPLSIGHAEQLHAALSCLNHMMTRDMLASMGLFAPEPQPPALA